MTAAAPLTKLDTALAPLLPHLALDDEPAAALKGVQTAAQGVDRLVAQGFRIEALRLVAYALPKREAVWWACMCAASVPDPTLAPADGAARTAAEAWVRTPADDALRRNAWAAAQQTEFKSTEAWAAVGAFWSGGSMAPEGQPVVPPGEYLTGQAISGAVVMAVVRRLPERAQDRMDRFIQSARDIAVGGAGRMPVEGD